MKKIVAALLSFVILFSGLVFTNASAQTAADSYSVSVSVTEQNGLLGGALSCDATQSVAKGDLVTVSAVPYYGNGFIGWYSGDTLVSNELTYSFAPTADVTLNAQFDIKNLFENGDMEVVSAQQAVEDGINNAAVKHNMNYDGTADVVSTDAINNVGNGYGSYALKLTPDGTATSAASYKVKNLANIPVTVEKNQNYIIRFSYRFDVATFTGNKHCIYISLNGLEKGAIPTRDSDHKIKWTYHSEKSNLTALNNSGWSWAGADGYDTADNNNSIAYYITDNNVNANGVWQNVYLLFNPKDDASIFGENETGTAYFNLGTHYTCTDYLYLDNLSISKATANSLTSVDVKGSGTVTADNNRSGENYYTYTTGSRGNDATTGSYSNRDTANIYYPSIYEKFTAKADGEAQFVGWYDEQGTCVSKAQTAYLLMTGNKYTARFASDISSEGGGYLLDNGDGTYTAKAYYGNKFLGWYNGTAEPYEFVTSEPTLEKQGNLGMVALFTNDNLIFDGDFEQNNNTAQVYTDYKDYSASYHGTVSLVPTCIENSGDEYGNSALQITPNQSTSVEKRKSLLNIPVSLTKGNTYIWKFSYAVISSAAYNNSTDVLYLSVDPAAANGAIPWNLWDKTTGEALVEGVTKYSYHIHGTTYAEDDKWLWGDYTSDGTTSYSTTNARSAVNKWLDVYVVFTAEASKTYYLTLGCADNATNSFVIDNMSLSTAQTGASTTAVTAEENGTVRSYGTYEPAYTATGARGASTIGTTPYYQDMYVDYFAVPTVGYLFDGWYSGDRLVSTDSVLRVKYISDESYKARFKADNNKYSVSATVDNTGGIRGGYLTGETVYTSVASGDKVTFTAECYAGNEFAGWYDGDTCLSTEPTFEYSVRKNATLTAKFTVNNLFDDSGYENTALGTAVMGNELEWNAADGASATVVGNEVFSGKRALMVSAPSKAFKHTAFTVEQSSVYYLSFMWKSAAADLEYVKVQNAQGGVIAESDGSVSGTGDWQKFYMIFDAAENSSVILEIKYASENSSIYLDDLILYDTAAVPFKITASVKAQDGIYGGYISGESEIFANYGSPVTVCAIPYEQNTFLGWYDGEKKLSDEPSFTFASYGFCDLVARFENRNLWRDSGYENTEADVSLSENGSFKVNENMHNNYGFDVTVTDDASFSGSKMLSALHRGNVFSKVISGLKANTDYFLTFLVRTEKTLDNCYFEYARVKSATGGTVLGTGFGTANGGQWEKISVPFNSGSCTEIEIDFLYQAGEKSCFFDDFALFESHNIGIYSGDGGSVVSDLNGGQNGPAMTGTAVTVTATPDAGNTFLGWYDYKNPTVLLSTANPYTFTVDSTQHIIAKFSGDGVEPENKIIDGDFENGCFEGFVYAGSTADANCDFCSYQITKKAGGVTPISGDYMLKLTANSRYSNLIVNNLKPFTDYTVSFYWLGNEYIDFKTVAAFRNREEYTGYLDQTTLAHLQNELLRSNLTDMLAKNSGYVNLASDGDGKNWRKVEFAFNSGNRTSAILQINYTRNGGQDGIYFDNFKVTEGSHYSDSLQNGDFESSGGFLGAYTTVDDGGNKAAASSGVLYGGVNMEPVKGYKLTFRAKSDSSAELLYGVARGGIETLYDGADITAMTNVSYGTAVLSGEWKTYTLTFQSTGYLQGNVIFQSLGGTEFMIDDISFCRADELVPVTRLTFEDTEEKYIINAAYESVLASSGNPNQNNPDWYEYSTVSHSGDYSLLMKQGEEYATHALSQPWASFKVESGRTYEVSFYAKADKAGAEFLSGVARKDIDFDVNFLAEHTYKLEDTEWTKFTYTFTTDNVLLAAWNKASFIVNGIEGKTDSDIYFDDITVRECANSVTETDAELLYTEDISQNYFENYSFEQEADALKPYITTGDTEYGERKLTLKAGDKVIIPVTTRTDYNLARECTYTFAASIRGDGNSKGTVGLSYSADGTQLLSDADGKAVSLTPNTNGKWERQGFSFAGNRNETEYLVIECTGGSFELDYIALFNAVHSFEEYVYGKAAQTDELAYSDMSEFIAENYVSGTLSGLPEGTQIVIKNDSKAYKSTLNGDGYYRIDGISDGSYHMYIAPKDGFMTLIGDISFESGTFSGLATERLSGELITVKGEGVRNGIVKIVDDDTGWAYLTATDSFGQYTAYILDCSWYIEGTTNIAQALKTYNVTSEQFK